MKHSHKQGLLSVLYGMRKLYRDGDETQRATLAKVALTFAVLTIQTQTKIAERRFVQVAANGFDHSEVKGIMGRYRNCIDQAWSMTESQWTEILTCEYPEIALANAFSGLAITKASFVLACAGVGKLGCIDSRLQKEYADVLAPHMGYKKLGKTVESQVEYTKALAALFPNVTNGDYAHTQWLVWLKGIEGEYTTKHECLLEAAQKAIAA